jgi:diacylglycerol kinase (ATP)
MRAVLILNPASGSSPMASTQGSQEEQEETILAELYACGIEPEVRYTTIEDTGTGLAQQAARDGFETVIAAGGDGTLHAVAAGLIGTKGKLGIIPIGTMNNIAHSLEIPQDIAEACKIIAQDQTTRIDVGRINGQIFLEVAGVGIEAALFPAAEEVKNSSLRTRLSGIIEGFAVLFTFQPTRFKISFDGKRNRRLNGIQISVCNSPYYGARLQFAPDAVMNDGLLDVRIYRNFSKLEYIRHAISISQGKHLLEPRIMRRKAQTIRIEADPSVEIHADGVPLGKTPAAIEVIPAALRVCVPAHIAAGPNVRKPQQRALRHIARERIDARQHEQKEEKGPSYV